MSKVCVFATLWIATAAKDHVLAELLAHQARCLSDEPGTLMFELMLPRDTAEAAHVYEVYEDQEAFNLHWTGASMAELKRATGDNLRIVSGIWGTPISLG